MTREVPSDVIADIKRGRGLKSAAIWIDGEGLSVWGGRGPLTIDFPAADTVYAGLQANGLEPPCSFEVGNAANGIEVLLSGSDPRLLPSFLATDIRGRDAIVYRLYCDKGGQVIRHVDPFFYGTVSRAPLREMPGGTTEIHVFLEGEARGMARNGAQMASDQSQRLVDPDDTAMVFVSSVPERRLYLGAAPGRRAAAIVNDGATGRG